MSGCADAARSRSEKCGVCECVRDPRRLITDDGRTSTSHHQPVVTLKLLITYLVHVDRCLGRGLPIQPLDRHEVARERAQHRRGGVGREVEGHRGGAREHGEGGRRDPLLELGLDPHDEAPLEVAARGRRLVGRVDLGVGLDAPALRG